MTGNVAHSLRLAAALASRVGMTDFHTACVEVTTASVAQRPDLEKTPLAAPVGTPEISLAGLSGPLAEPVRETLTLASKALRALSDVDVLRSITESVRTAAEIPRDAWLKPRTVAEAAVFGAVGRLVAQPEILTPPVPDAPVPEDTDDIPGYS